MAGVTAQEAVRRAAKDGHIHRIKCGEYHDILERTQKRSMDVTEWLAWFLDTLHRTVDQTQHTLDAVLTKARFWQRWATTALNERQRIDNGYTSKHDACICCVAPIGETHA